MFFYNTHLQKISPKQYEKLFEYFLPKKRKRENTFRSTNIIGCGKMKYFCLLKEKEK